MSYLRTHRRPGLSGASSFANLLATPVKAPLLGRAGTTLSASTASSLLAGQSTRKDDGPGTNGTLTNPDGSTTAYHVNSDGSLTVTAVYGSPGAGGGAPPPPAPDPGLPPPPPAAGGSSSTILILGALAAAAFFFLKRH